jgi:hypothetical protein
MSRLEAAPTVLVLFYCELPHGLQRPRLQKQSALTFLPKTKAASNFLPTARRLPSPQNKKSRGHLRGPRGFKRSSNSANGGAHPECYNECYNKGRCHNSNTQETGAAFVSPLPDFPWTVTAKHENCQADSCGAFGRPYPVKTRSARTHPTTSPPKKYPN